MSRTPRFETESAKAECVLDEARAAAMAEIEPHARLRWATARATAEVVAAMDDDERLTSVEREIIGANAQNFMAVVDVVDRMHRDGA